MNIDKYFMVLVRKQVTVTIRRHFIILIIDISVHCRNVANNKW